MGRFARVFELSRRAVRLSARERRLAVEALLLLLTARGVLRTLPAGVSGPALRRAASAPVASGALADPRIADEVAFAIERAARRLDAATCLERALVGWLMLRRRGIGAEVRFGARRASAGLAAHAWLEVAGRTVLGLEDEPGHVRFPSVP